MTDAKSNERAERLKAALKENLKRRKAQARGRQAAEGERTASEGGGQASPRRRDEGTSD